MAVVQLTYQQEELIQNSARKCGFENFEVDANVGTFKGDNYLGIITTVKIREKDNGKVIYFILKSAHTNETFRKAAPIARAFAREAYMYNTILPRLFKLQTENNITDPFTGAAKYYDSCLNDTNESILMENLKENNYKLWDRKTPMNDKHVTLVFSEYARFHAASLALRHHHPEEFKELSKELQFNIFETETPNPELFEKFFEMHFKSGLSALEGNIKATTALKRMQKSITQLFSESKDNDKDQQVVLHGDCWCNNLLFHYEDNSPTPTKVCLIDWQLSKLGSPVHDLAYFFCVCSAKDVLQELPKYLKIYHTVLSDNLKELKCDPEKLFSFDTLMYHWKKYSWFGVFMATMILKIMLSDSEEIPDMVDAVDKGQEIMQAFEFETSKYADYKTRLTDLVEFMADNNYI